jgi:alanyl-tRNA synthetase
MTGHEVRTKFLEFFRSQGHKIVASDSLVPKDDPTVLFTTAGMQQFKPQFMGHTTGFTRAASSQKCLRTDDLPEIGVTDYHHTFFEMLGNFSFGDYFKREAILWGWEFLTDDLKIPGEKLWVSVHKDDEEAYNVWLKEVKVPANRIVKLGDKSNFWPSNARENGPNGPCGPCSEIFYDWGKNPDCKNPDCSPACNCGRFCEIWNLVFTQYNRQEGGVLEPLPSKNIDTGMGLERLTAVIQGKRNNFETDLFQPIIVAITKAVAAEGKTLSLKETRVVADHIRAVTFGLSDGVIPSNEGRGYVMRRLIVDMTNIMIQAGIKKPLVHTFVSAVVGIMKGPYPDLIGKEKDVTATIKRVEEAVIKQNAEKGPEYIEEQIKIKERHLDEKELIDALGRLMFRYRDTFGLSQSFMEQQAKEFFGVSVTMGSAGVAQVCMTEQKERSRAGSKMQGDVFLNSDVDVKGLPKTEFLGNEQMNADVSVVKIFVAGAQVAEVKDGDGAVLVLDRTPFYAEQGGQVTDFGTITGKNGTFEVLSVQKVSDVYVHKGRVVKGMVKVGDVVHASIDDERRLNIMRNHTATHLLQTALRQVLGEHVKQQGSAVDAERLRFDFTHPKALTRDQLELVEDLVNSFIRHCDVVHKKEMSIEEAKKSGALAFFAEKYGEKVRVVSVGDYSKEFCGGTHLDSTGQIGLFKITSEGAVAQGIRRLEAVTGTGALEYVKARERLLEKAAAVLKAPVDELVSRVEVQAKRVKDLEKEVANLNFYVIKDSLSKEIENAEQVNGITFFYRRYPNIDVNTLRRVSDLVMQKCPTAVTLLASTTADDVAVIVSLSADLVKKGISAGDIVKKLAPLFNGSGGGRPNLAQAGGKDPAKFLSVFDKAKALVKESINV